MKKNVRPLYPAARKPGYKPEVRSLYPKSREPGYKPEVRSLTPPKRDTGVISHYPAARQPGYKPQVIPHYPKERCCGKQVISHYPQQKTNDGSILRTKTDGKNKGQNDEKGIPDYVHEALVPYEDGLIKIYYMLPEISSKELNLLFIIHGSSPSRCAYNVKEYFRYFRDNDLANEHNLLVVEPIFNRRFVDQDSQQLPMVSPCDMLFFSYGNETAI